HTLAVPAPAQVLPPVQPPAQSSVPPQPSGMVPHSAAGFRALQLVAGVQQVYGPSTHTSPLLQLPQSTIWPQPSLCWPQLPVQARGWQMPHTLAVPAPPQVSAPWQVPHSTLPPQPSETVPQFAPSCAQLFGEQ